MGKNVSKFVPKYVKDFNIENRMHKYVDKEIKLQQQLVKKSVQPAPRHPSTQKILEEVEKNAPSLDTFEINSKVNEMLKQVKVVSSGTNLEFNQSNNNKNKLPQYNQTIDSYLYGYKEPDKIPQGKISLKLFNEMVKENNDKPEINNINLLSNKYKLEKDLIETLLTYYKPFQALNEKDLNNKRPQKQTDKQETIFIKSTQLLNATETTKPNKL